MAKPVATHSPDFFSNLFAPVRHFGERIADFFSPTSDASSAEGQYEINLELPGVSEDDITVDVHDGRLTISGEKRSEHEETGKSYFFSERSYGSFQRVFHLPDDSVADKIDAHFKKGVLTIIIPRTAPKPEEARQIKVKAGD